jgi:NTP pyrophosphatase (non-canonical NTP hydrolase)
MEVREFQRWMEERYGARDRARGLPATFCWFVEEVGEVSQALRKGTRAEQEHEFADAFAWLVSAANLAGIDVQAALDKHYAAGCPKCGRIPCACPVAPGVAAPRRGKPRARPR